jgi:helix-turn-helix protein
MSETTEAKREGSETASEEEWLTTGEAAEILGTSVSTVRRLADDGTLVSRRQRMWSQRESDSMGRKLKGHRRVSAGSVARLRAVQAERGGSEVS